MIQLHALRGCAPQPLGRYLKAIAVLRIVATQIDAEARGWWDGDTWMLATRMSRAELNAFFLEAYAPTPAVSPWNKGSGFFNAADALNALADSSAPRFEPFRAAIVHARSLLAELIAADAAIRKIKGSVKGSMAEKKKRRADPEYKAQLAAADREFKVAKSSLLPRLRREWRGPHLDWMEAAMTLAADASPDYPPMLGTGGNDGRFDFTNNFMQRLGSLFQIGVDGGPAPEAASLLDGSLWGETTRGLVEVGIGQFSPSEAGGANSSNGPTASGRVNPWELVFALEGSIAFAAASTRKLAAKGPAGASTPFMVRSHAAGHGSASPNEDAPRGEQWLPLWSRPMSFGEVQSLLGEGRAQLDRRDARQPLDLARAIARLGVARGLVGFERYGYLERNGQSNLAVPLGRIAVVARPHARLLDDVGDWLGRLQREARGKGASARLKGAERRIADAAFEAVTHDGAPDRCQAVLLAMADIETLIAMGSVLKSGPIPKLRPEWISESNDGSAEHRLAVSLGRATALSSQGYPVDPIRHHWLPLDRRGRLQIRDGRLARDPRVVAHSRDPIADLIGLVGRRLIEAGSSAWCAPLVSNSGASLVDLAALLSGSIDLDRTLRLARAFMAVDRTKQPPRVVKPSGNRSTPDEAWLCVRAALSPWPLVEGGKAPPGELEILQRLATGDAESAVRLALRRLQAMGLPAGLRVAVTDPQSARRWAAALAFPISEHTARNIAQRLCPESKEGV